MKMIDETNHLHNTEIYIFFYFIVLYKKGFYYFILHHLKQTSYFITNVIDR